MNTKKGLGIGIFVGLIIVFVFVVSLAIVNVNTEINKEKIRIISSTDNQDLELIIQKYADKNNLNVQIDYAGTLEIMDRLNAGEEYDAVLASNSIWLYMLENVSTSNSTDAFSTPSVESA